MSHTAVTDHTPSSQDTKPITLMAIINVTPDSFSDGGHLQTIDAAVTYATQCVKAGAGILDIGGESTRPGAECVPAELECQRVVPVIAALKQTFPNMMISIDTRKSMVAQAAIDAGATMVNDVSGLQHDPDLVTVVARAGVSLVITHSQGTPETMQLNPHYPEGVVQTVKGFLVQQVQKAISAGVQPEKITIDPGFGFGKTVAHNFLLLQQLEQLVALGYPVLAGLSRKSFLSWGQPKTLTPSQRDGLSTVAMTLAYPQGVRLFRVHDVEVHQSVARFLEASHCNMSEKH